LTGHHIVATTLSLMSRTREALSFMYLWRTRFMIVLQLLSLGDLSRNINNELRNVDLAAPFLLKGLSSIRLLVDFK
jgi:hypothetical protein